MRAFAARLFVVLLGFHVTSSSVLAEDGAHIAAVNPWMVTPFALLLLAIALMPFIHKQWWEHNYPFVSVALGAVTIGYYVFWLDNPARMLHTGREYLSFIALIGSLFVVAGGIHIRIKGRAKPLANVYLLSVGAVLANIVGTTGASMILIRPYLRTNRYRIKPYHVVFFIFIVSNMGGALTPIGDPPLFLGYLKGIPFFWIVNTIWYKWAVAMAVVLGVFYVIDYMQYHKLPADVQQALAGEHETGEASGVHNVFYLVLILIAVFVTNPPFLRELLMISAAVASYFTTRHEIHKKNDFNFAPIKEVGILFLGIFATMVPALDWLSSNSSEIGVRSVGQYYWFTGVFSAVLDNAPTYLNFLSAAIGLHVSPEVVREMGNLVQTRGADLSLFAGANQVAVKNGFMVLMQYHFDLVSTGQVPVDYLQTAYLMGNHDKYVQAISLAAVFFGAITYIGNGPNFMVKSIAEQNGVPCPGFFGYIFKYSLPVLLPVLIGIWLLFFHL